MTTAPTAVPRERSAELKGCALRGHREGRSPLWSHFRFSDRPPQPGLWAVEPHPGFRGTGAKFEEILVGTGSADLRESTFWLDEDLPHTRRWAEAQAKPGAAGKAEGSDVARGRA